MQATTSVTLSHIAKAAGISASAVSAILGNRHVERRISAPTVQKVREIALAMGYVPNMASRRLRRHRRATRQYDIAIFTSFEAPLSLASGLLGVLQAESDRRSSEHTRYALAIEMFHGGRLKEKPGLLDANRYHGVLIANTLPADDKFLANTTLPYATVVLGRRIPGHFCVLEAPGLVGRRAAEALARAGRGHLAIIYGEPLTQSTSERMASFTQAVRRHDLPAPKRICCEGLQPGHAMAAVKKFLSNKGRCDGVFVVTDSLAIGAYQVFQEEGFRIPNDISMIGVGDFALTNFFMPQISTLVCTNNTMTEKAMPLLFDQLGGKRSQPHEVHVTPPDFLKIHAD